MKSTKITDAKNLAVYVDQQAPNRLLDRFDSADHLNISTRLLDKLASEGAIPRIKIGRKTLFRMVDLDEFALSQMQK